MLLCTVGRLILQDELWPAEAGVAGSHLEGVCVCQTKQGRRRESQSRSPAGGEETAYVHEEGHHSSTEEPGHGHRHEPGHKYVPEEAPVHSLPGADPAHGYHGAHLEEQRRLGRNEVTEEGTPSQTVTFSCL